MDDWFGLQRGLVAVGLLTAVPGCADDKDKTTEGTGTDPGSTGATDGTGTGTTGTTGGTTGDPPTGTGSGSATDSGTGTTGEPTTGGTSTTGGIDIPPVCQSYAANVAGCMDPMAGMDAEQYCAAALMGAEYFGADCVQAYEAYLVCLSAIACPEFMDPDVCLAEFTVLEAACQ